MRGEEEKNFEFSVYIIFLLDAFRCTKEKSEVFILFAVVV
jgi:hypothetical protein